MKGSKNNKRVFLLGSIWLLTTCAQAPPQDAAPPPVQIPAQVQVSRAAAIESPDPYKPWLLVDTRLATLTVMKGASPLETIDHVAIGSGGAGIKHHSGDHKTPIGIFRVGWLNEKSRFNLFIGLDYPNLEYAERGYRERLIDASSYAAIRSALENGHTPPQDTPLGGSIGIHGLGAGNPFIHASLNWTDGCIAVDNEQIMRLAAWVKIGTRVVIR